MQGHFEKTSQTFEKKLNNTEKCDYRENDF